MTIETWFAFVAASAVLLVIPGPTILTVISYSVSHGRRSTIPLVAAVALGDATALSLSLVGLGAILATSAFWFAAVKGVGGLYLIYLGLKLLRENAAPTLLRASGPSVSHMKLFFNTYLVTALNPKGIVFFIAFLPQFVSPGSPAAPQLWLLAFTFIGLAAVNAALYALFAGSARNMLSSSKTRRGFNLTGGFLLITAGLWALLVRRTA